MKIPSLPARVRGVAAGGSARFRHLLPLALLLSGVPMLGAQTTYTFNTNASGSTPSWATASTWTNNSGMPATNDTVIMMGGNGKSLAVNGNRTIKDLLFTNGLGAATLLSGTTNGLLTITGVLTADGAQQLTLRSSGTGVLSMDINQIDASGANNLLFGSSAANTFGTLKIGTLNLNTSASAGVFFYSEDAAFAQIGTVNLTEGRIVLRNLTSGTTTLEVGALSGTGGSIRAANTQVGATGILRITNTSGTASFGGQLLDGVAGSVLNVEKTGAGTQVLTGTNTYTGYTLVSGGLLQIGNGGGTGTLGSGIVTNHAVLAFNRSNSLGHTGSITGSGQLVQAGSGTLTLSGANSYTGGTAINAGTLALGSADAVGSTGTISFGGGILQFSAGNTNDYSGRFSTAASQQVNIDTAGQNVTFAAALTSSGGGLSKSGAGTLTLTASNTYNGGTAINGGTVLLSGGNNRLATNGGVTISSGSVLDLGGSSQMVSTLTGSGVVTNTAGILTVGGSGSGTFSGVIAGGGGLTKAGDGTLTLSGANTHTGGTILDAGTLVLGNNNRLADAGSVTINGGVFDLGGFSDSVGAVVVNGGVVTNGNLTGSSYAVTSGTISARLLGADVALTKTGAGTTVLSGSNTYTGGTFINGGVLSVSDRSGFASRLLSFNGGTLEITSEFGAAMTSVNNTTLNAGGGTIRIAAGVSQSWGSAVISGDGALTKSGAGTLVLAANNTYTGGTVLNEGTLSIDAAGRINGTNGVLTFNGGILRNTGNVGISKATTITAAGGTFDTVAGATNTWNGFVSGAGGITKTGEGVLILGGSSNNFGGGVAINGGSLSVASDSRLGDTNGAVSFAGGTLRTTANFSSGRTAAIGAGGGTFDVASSTTNTWGGSMTGSNALHKTGDGVLVLTASNTFSGAVGVDAGTLSLNSTNGSALGSVGSVSVTNAATLLISQSEQVADAATVTLSGGTIQRAGGVSETFGNLELAADSFLNFGSAAGDDFFKFGTLTLNSFTLGVSHFLAGNMLQYQADSYEAGEALAGTFSFTSSHAYSYSFDGGTFTITAIPEPATVVAAAALLACLSWGSWRGRRTQGVKPATD